MKNGSMKPEEMKNEELRMKNGKSRQKGLYENCVAPLALGDSVPLHPPLPRWANDFRRSAAGLRRFWTTEELGSELSHRL